MVKGDTSDRRLLRSLYVCVLLIVSISSSYAIFLLALLLLDFEDRAAGSYLNGSDVIFVTYTYIIVSLVSLVSLQCFVKRNIHIVIIAFLRLMVDYKFRLEWLQPIIHSRAQRYILLVASLVSRRRHSASSKRTPLDWEEKSIFR